MAYTMFLIKYSYNYERRIDKVAIKTKNFLQQNNLKLTVYDKRTLGHFTVSTTIISNE
jgi:hypothetical protein